jgi:putative transposase
VEATGQKTFKYKLYPTPEQERALERILYRCRTLYNVALEERKTAWKRCGVSVNYYQQKAELPDLKAGCPEYAEINAQILQDVILRVERAYQTFFRRLKAGEKPGYPRFQGRNRYHSFTYPQYGGGAVLNGGMLSLSKIGRVPIRVHRPLEGTPKTVTVSREADGWYACISCAEVPANPLPPSGQETGIDVGLKVFLVTAQGMVFENPRYLRRAERRLEKAQQRVSRRKQGSHRRHKAVALLAKVHQDVRRQRADFHHKTALALLDANETIYNETIYLEDLQVRNLVRNQTLAKSISDAGWAQLRTILAAKAACAGRRVIVVNPVCTSQECSGCGTLVRKSLSVRTHVCTSCGLVLDRDVNAARKIQRAGQALRGLAGVPAGLNREAPSL